jgi:polyribonucleotide nucleotidyltransferase
MASVCASTLSLMDAGVPILAPVAGIAMGLIHRHGKYVTLTDILGAEDALGDMDFKVAGTAESITALQLDTKLQGLPSEVLTKALEQAREARLFILGKMAEVISGPRTELNPWAPRIETIQIPKDKIGEVIGPKGKVVRELEEQTGAQIEIEEGEGYGIVRIASADGESLRAAVERVKAIVFPPEAELGKEYQGEVVNITKFGAFINILPGRDGLLHISKLDPSKRVERVEDYVKLGDKITVVLQEIDRNGKLSLGIPGQPVPERESRPADGNRDNDRPPRDRDRDRDRPHRDRPERDREPRPDRAERPSQSGPEQTSADQRRPAPAFDEQFEKGRRD